MFIEKIKLLKNLKIDESKGEMSIGGVRFLMISPELLCSLQRNLLKIGPVMERMFYDAGKDCGKEFARSVSKVFKIKDKDGFVDMCEKFGTLSGWGKLTIVEKDYDNDRYRINLSNSFLSGAGEKGKKNCYFNAGMLAGSAEIILKKEMDAVETKCASQGHSHCEFLMKPSKEFV